MRSVVLDGVQFDKFCKKEDFYLSLSFRAAKYHALLISINYKYYKSGYRR